MSCSKPLPPFVFDSLYYLNRNQLERFSIVCRPLKNFIDRYFHAKPYRIFDKLRIRTNSGLYALVDINGVQWHPNRDDYSTQQFLAGQECNIDFAYYSFAEMRPYLGPTIRIKRANIYLDGGSNYCQDHVEEMESISYLWRDRRINVSQTVTSRIVPEDFQPILNSPTILQCQVLSVYLYNARISFKDYKVSYAVKVIEIRYNREEDIDLWQQFLEQPGVKPIIVLQYLRREYIKKLLHRLSKAFSSAISPNAFKIVFGRCNAHLTEFREANTTLGEVLELKKGVPIEYQDISVYQYNNYTLERANI